MEYDDDGGGMLPATQLTDAPPSPPPPPRSTLPAEEQPVIVGRLVSRSPEIIYGDYEVKVGITKIGRDPAQCNLVIDHEVRGQTPLFSRFVAVIYFPFRPFLGFTPASQ